MSITIERTLAASPVTTRGQPTQLSTDAAGTKVAYASGKSIFLRSIDDPSDCVQYTEHTAQATVARIAPLPNILPEYRIASGDVTGLVRVWAATADGIRRKDEWPAFSGRVNDIAFASDGDRVIAVGDGREKFGHAFNITGGKVGEVTGHSKVINAVAIRPTERTVRAISAVTVSDDASVCFLGNVPSPLHFQTKVDDVHKGFVLGTAISPDGSTLITVGADKRIQLYLYNEEKTPKGFDHTKTIGEGEHTGSIFAVSWSSDSKRFVTASADHTIKMWDAESGKVIRTWKLGADRASIDDQQVGVVWPHGRSDGLIISLSLGGDLYYLKEESDKPIKTVQGHNKSITAMGGNSETLWTGSFDGRVCTWDIASGVGTVVDGTCHTNQITGFASTPGGVYSVGWDDTLHKIDISTNTFTGAVQKLSMQPTGIAAADGRVYVATQGSVGIYVNSELVGELNVSEPLTSIAAHGSFVAVGTTTNAVQLYKVDGANKLIRINEAKNSVARISALAFSKDGSLLAAGNQNGKIYAYKTDDLQIVTDRWSAHTGRVTSLAWNDAGTQAISGSLDTHIYVWSLAKPGARVNMLNAHKDGVYGVTWVGENKVASTGGDATIKIWNVAGVQ
ncbi:putative WD domain-containing protein [Rosellinia necatrix]|uniref:Putative WD domain-containing protein n=1 Tax=Rosellinia necatrix TaxID=77044 RepID=A0A1S7UIV5_ROSNE|nr:putative WD domain-containing protein [Rosellinia necatrix]